MRKSQLLIVLVLLLIGLWGCVASTHIKAAPTRERDPHVLLGDGDGFANYLRQENGFAK